MGDAEVLVIAVASKGGAPLQAKDEVQLEAGKGILGDRYAEGGGTFSRKPDPKRQLTLIAAEDLDEARAASGLEFDALASRRNLVVRGWERPLDRLVGMRFRIESDREGSEGEAPEIEIVSSCPPCGWLDRCGPAGLHEALKGRGGVYAVVHSGGSLRVGDRIQPVPGSEPRRLP
jgi:MOSC domain-containing protein YiiM